MPGITAEQVSSSRAPPLYVQSDRIGLLRKMMHAHSRSNSMGRTPLRAERIMRLRNFRTEAAMNPIPVGVDIGKIVFQIHYIAPNSG